MKNNPNTHDMEAFRKAVERVKRVNMQEDVPPPTQESIEPENLGPQETAHELICASMRDSLGKFSQPMLAHEVSNGAVHALVQSSDPTTQSLLRLGIYVDQLDTGISRHDRILRTVTEALSDLSTLVGAQSAEIRECRRSIALLNDLLAPKQAPYQAPDQASQKPIPTGPSAGGEG